MLASILFIYLFIFCIVLSCSFFWSIFFCLSILFCFLCSYALGERPTSNLEGLILGMVIPYVNFVSLVTFAGWLELLLI